MTHYDSTLSWKGTTWRIDVNGPGQVWKDADDKLHIRLEGYNSSMCGAPLNTCYINVITLNPLLWYHRYETTAQDLLLVSNPPPSGNTPPWFTAPMWYAKYPWDDVGEIDYEFFYLPSDSAIKGRYAEFIYYNSPTDTAQACWNNWEMSSVSEPVRNVFEWFQDFVTFKTYVDGIEERSDTCAHSSILDESDSMHLYITISANPAGDPADGPHEMVMTDFQATPIPTPHTAIDSPASNATVSQPFDVTGWALDRGSPSGPGVNNVHLWAFPVSGGGGTFVGQDYGESRPDVATVMGATRFTNSGYTIGVSGLTPGTYDLVTYAYSTVSGTWNPTVRRVTIN